MDCKAQNWLALLHHKQIVTCSDIVNPEPQKTEEKDDKQITYRAVQHQKQRVTTTTLAKHMKKKDVSIGEGKGISLSMVIYLPLLLLRKLWLR